MRLPAYWHSVCSLCMHYQPSAAAEGYSPSVHACSAGKMCSQVRRQIHNELARRAREKVHRPQTRRRRENNEDSLDKMQQMRKNIRKAVEIMEHLVRREHKKLHIAVSPLSFQKALFSGLPHRPSCSAWHHQHLNAAECMSFVLQVMVCLKLQYVETDLQKLQMELKTEPRQAHEAMEAEYAAAARAKPVRRPPDLDTSGKPSGPTLIAPTRAS